MTLQLTFTILHRRLKLMPQLCSTNHSLKNFHHTNTIFNPKQKKKERKLKKKTSKTCQELGERAKITM